MFYQNSVLVYVAARCLLHIQTRADPIQSCEVEALATGKATNVS